MNSINYTDMTPAQAHFAGRLRDLLEHLKGINNRPQYRFDITARSGESLDLNITEPAFQYAPLAGWLEHTIWEVVRIDDEDVWRAMPDLPTVVRAGYDSHTGQVAGTGEELTGNEEPRVMEVPDGWTETALHVLMECSDLHPETILTQTRTEQVLGALEVDHPDHERLALWLHDVEGETVTLRGLIENCEDWAETEQARHDYSYSDREEYAREWVSDHNHMEHWLMDCLDLEAVAGYLLDDMHYTEARDGELHLYEV